MHKTGKEILKVLQGNVPDRTPIWLMRQAGRYLPEYRELRAKAENFLNLCLTPEWATEITVQPIRRFNVDAAILFADILLVPMALGAGLKFQEGEGPVLEHIDNAKRIAELKFDEAKVAPVYETVSRVKSSLPAQTALIGFCGSPWTVACYMIDGNSKGGFALAKEWAAQKSPLLDDLIQKIIDASVTYLSRQIEAGAEILQLFDSWGGLLKGPDFTRYIIEPTQKITAIMKQKYPHIPLIGFPREAANKDYVNYAQQAGTDAMSIDYDVKLDFAKRELQPLKILQGNLHPDLLVKGGNEMIEAAGKILATLGPRHIFNLGHGVVPQTPPEHVAQLVEFVHQYKFRA